jgi:hypothetical protein
MEKHTHLATALTLPFGPDGLVLLQGVYYAPYEQHLMIRTGAWVLFVPTG